MGYDLHITRAEDWTLSDKHPISEDEWMEVVNEDSTLEVSLTDYYERANIKKNGQTERFHPVVWLTHPRKPAFWLMDGEIVKNSADKTVVDKMVEIAQKLNARVFGDDGEEYTSEGVVE